MTDLAPDQPYEHGARVVLDAVPLAVVCHERVSLDDLRDLEVVGATLPAGPALAATHLGAYDGLGDAWAGLAQVPGATPTGAWIEVYVSDPSDPSTDLRTDLLMPVSE